MKKITKVFLLTVLIISISLTAFAGDGEDAAKDSNSGIVLFEESGIEEFNESPMLEERVEAGDLPPVEERLPENPVVVEPEEEVGTYGGSMTFTQFGPEGLGVNGHVLVETPLLKNRDLDNLFSIPNFAEDWEYSEDGKTFTLHLREGVRWSDGEELTTDDVMFWYEDILLNKDITTSIPVAFRPGGEVMEVEAIDDYTVEFNFEEPYYNFHENMDSTWYAGLEFFPPSHYMKQFHIDYNEDADEIAEEEDFDSWIQYFNNRLSWEFFDPKPVGRPVLSAWVPVMVTSTGRIYERNPYYFKVDTEGNQLPYIDEQRTIYTPDAQARLSNVLSGEIDYISSFLGFSDYPTIKENEDDGDYDAWIGDSLWASRVTFSFQQQPIDDEDMWDILGDKRFRQALSLALDRSEIKELVFMGQGEERQLAYHPGTVPEEAFKEEWAEAFAEYDPEQAKELLDDMGVVDEDGDGWREKPNGDDLLVNLLANSSRGVAMSTAEMAEGFWKDIGVNINLDSVEEGLFFDEIWEGQTHIATTFMTGSVPPWDQYTPAEDTYNAYGNWLLDYDHFTDTRADEDEIPESRRELAVEPPEDIIEWYRAGHLMDHSTPEEQIEHLKFTGDKVAEELPSIGTVGMAGHVGVSKRGLKNIRKVGDNPSIGATRNAYIEQFFWENPEEHEEEEVEGEVEEDIDDVE
ncbi:MAG: ABC transporter substrate-binding protein [Halanaerobium sp.]